MAYQNVVGTRLAQAETTASYVTVYTVPPSMRTYVKNIDICNTTSGPLRFYIHLVIRGHSATVSNSLFYNAPINANTTVQWTGTEIMNGGDTIQIKGSATGIAVSVSGGEAT